MADQIPSPDGAAAVPLQRPDARYVLLFALPFLIHAAAVLVMCVRLVFVHNDAGYPEGANVYAFLTSHATGRLYGEPFQPPFNGQMYGPFFYLVGWLAAALARGAPLLTAEIMRVISLGSVLGTAALIGCLTWTLEPSRALSSLSVIVSLATLWLIPNGASARSDALGVLLVFAALLLYQRAGRRLWLLFFAGALGALACLTKQPMAAPVFGLVVDCALSLWLTAAALRRPPFRRLCALSAGLILPPALLFLVLWLRQEPFVQNLTLARYCTSVWSRIATIPLTGVRLDELSLLIVAVASAGLLLRWRHASYRPIILVFFFGTVTSLIATENLGSNINYLILPWMLLVLFVPAGLIRIKRRHPTLIIPLAASLLGCGLVARQWALMPELPRSLDASPIARLTLFSDLSYLDIRSAHPQIPDPFFYNQTAVRAAWHADNADARIAQQQYDLILIRLPGPAEAWHWAPPMLEDISDHYTLLCTVDGELAYIPRDRPVPLIPADLEKTFNAPCTPRLNEAPPPTNKR